MAAGSSNPADRIAGLMVSGRGMLRFRAHMRFQRLAQINRRFQQLNHPIPDPAGYRGSPHDSPAQFAPFGRIGRQQQHLVFHIQHGVGENGRVGAPTGETHIGSVVAHPKVLHEPGENAVDEETVVLFDDQLPAFGQRKVADDRVSQ